MIDMVSVALSYHSTWYLQAWQLLRVRRRHFWTRLGKFCCFRCCRLHGLGIPSSGAITNHVRDSIIADGRRRSSSQVMAHADKSSRIAKKPLHVFVEHSTG